MKGFDAAGGAAMKMFLTVRGDALGLVGWAMPQFDYRNPDKHGYLLVN